MRVDAGRVALNKQNVVAPVFTFTFQTTIWTSAGWLAGAPNSFTGIATAPVEARVKWAELGAKVAPDGGSVTVAPFARLHHVGFHGPASTVVDLLDPRIEPLLGAVLSAVSHPPPSAGSPAAFLLDALEAVGLAVPDNTGGAGLSADAFAALLVDPAGFLAPRLAGALAASGLLGFGGPPSGPWTMPLPGGFAEIYVAPGTAWQMGVRTTVPSVPLGVTTGLGFDARIGVLSLTPGLDLSLRLGAVTLTRSEPGGQLTVAASPWLEPLTLLPAPPGNVLADSWNNLIPRLLISSTVSTLLEALIGPAFRHGPIDRLLGAPGKTLGSSGSLGSGTGLDADRLNMLLGVIAAALGQPAGQEGLLLPAGLKLTAGGKDPVTVRLETTATIGNVLGFQLDAKIDSLRHVTPAGTLTLDVPLPLGTWQGVKVAFGVSPAGVSLALTPDTPGFGTLQLLPVFGGLGSFLQAGAATLLPQALDALLDALGMPLPPLAQLAVNAAGQLALYDPQGHCSAHSAEWQKLLQSGYLAGLAPASRAAFINAVAALFSNPASPLKGTVPGQVKADPSGQSLTWSCTSTQGTLALTAGWTPGPTLLVQATNLKFQEGPLTLDLAAGSASGTLQCMTRLGLALQKIVPIPATPQFSAAFNGAGFDVNLYPLGDAGPASAFDVALLPAAKVTFGAGGPQAFLDHWLVPLIADRVLEANRQRLTTPVWGGGKTLHTLLNDAGLITGSDQLHVPLPPLPAAVSNVLLGLATGLKIPVTKTLNLQLVNEQPVKAQAKAVGLRLVGHQDFPAGSLNISLRFGEGPFISAQNRGLTLYLFRPLNPAVFAPQLDVVGLGVRFSDASGGPLVNLPVARANDIAGYFFFSFPLDGKPYNASLYPNFGAAVEIGGFGIPLGAALSGNTGGDNPVAAGLLQSDGKGDPHPVNPDVDVYLGYVDQHLKFQVQGTAAVWVGIHRKFGPIYIDQIGVELGSSPPEASLLVDGSVSISGLTVQADELGVRIPIKSLATPAHWYLDLRGLGISFNSGSVSITGGLLKNQVGQTVEYDGMLSVDIAGKGFTAVGAYSRPGDALGSYTSLFVFVSLPLVLGGPPFFFVTGLGGGMGCNRELQVPPINQIPDFLLVKALSDSSLANDPMGALTSMAKFIPARRGSFWLAAGVKFDSFVLVHSVAVIYVALDKGFEIGLVGVSRLALPTKDLAIVNIELALKARFSSAEGILSIQAQLTDHSYLFSDACQLTGGFAFFIWFPQGQFVLTVGGYHPAFNRPPQFPTVPRLGFRWHVSDAIVIKGEAYFALTNTCVMAGGRLEAAAHLGPVRAWFIAHADFLVSWDPFYYDISIGVEVGVSVTICIFVCGTLELSLGAELHIMGPPLHGTVSVDITVATITVPFGPDPKPDPNYIQDFEVFRKKYLVAGDKKSKVVNVSATRGLVPKDPPGADPAPGTKSQPWKVAAEFGFATETRMPASSYSTFATAPSGQLAGSAAIDLAPMNRRDVVSNHDVKLYLAGADTVPAFTADHFQVTPVFGKFPEATWHWTDPVKISAGARTIPALHGLDIRGVAVWGGPSQLIPIATLIDDKLVWARPLPFAASDVILILTLQQYGVSADSMAVDIVKVSNGKMLQAADQILSGGGVFAQFRQQLGVRPSGLRPMSRHSLAHRRSAPPLIAPLATGLTMKVVSLPPPPPIFRVPPDLPVPLQQARLRAVLQHRPRGHGDSPGRIHTTVERVSAPNAPRTAPPRVFPLAGARLIRIGALKAPLPTRAAIAPRSIHNTQIGVFASPAHTRAFAAAAAQLTGRGVILPSGTTHIWDLPGQTGLRFALSGAAAARIVFFDRGGAPLLDREMVPQTGQQIAVPPRAASVAITCLGNLPPGVAAPAPGFAAVAMAVAPAGGLPSVGWQAGNHGTQVSALTVLARGSSLVLPRRAAALHRRQKTGQAVIRVAQALRGQNGISTWLPARSGVVMVILDAQDPTAAAKGDFAISADGASLVTPPAVISGGHRRALLYDVVPRPADITGAGGIAPDHIVVAAGSGGGWEVSGVVSLPGKAIEWANRLHGRVPRTLTPDGPLTPSGSVLVRLLGGSTTTTTPRS